MLDDEFSNADLITALETLHQNADKRDALGRKAREVIATRHAPEICARHYAEAIEAFYVKARTGLPALLDAIAATPPRPDETGCRALVTGHRSIFANETTCPAIAARRLGNVPHRTQDRDRTGGAGLGARLFAKPAHGLSD